MMVVLFRLYVLVSIQWKLKYSEIGEINIYQKDIWGLNLYHGIIIMVRKYRRLSVDFMSRGY